MSVSPAPPGPAAASPLREGRAAALAALGAGAVSLLVYRLTLMPGVGLIDSGELALAAWLPGNAHPPGSPVYLLFGWLFSRLPIGSVAFRMNLFSAVSTALAAAAVGLAAWQAGRRRPAAAPPTAPPESKRRKGKPPAPAEPLPASPVEPSAGLVWTLFPLLAAAGAFAFARSAWAYAVVTEVYAPNAALLAGCVAALFRWRASAPDGRRWLALAAFLFGLSLGVHHGSALALAPAILALLLATEGRTLLGLLSPRRRGGRDGEAARLLRDGGVAALWMAGALLAYLYLPLRAAGRPLLNWGDPSTWTTFWWHVSTKWFQVFLFEEPLSDSLPAFLSLLTGQLGVAGTAVVAAGVLAAMRRDRALALFCLLVPAGNFAVLFAYGASDDRPAFVLPTVVALALLVGEAVRWAVALLRRPGAGGRAVALASAAAGVVPLLALGLGWRASDQSRNDLAPAFARNLMAPVGERGLLLTAEWIATASPLLYLQHVEGFRDDVTVVDVNLVRRSWYEGYVAGRDPALYAGVRGAYAEFQRNLWFFEHDRCGGPRAAPQCAAIQGSFERLLTGMVEAARAAGRPVHLTPDVDASVTAPGAPPIAAGLARLPVGLTAFLAPAQPPGPIAAPPLDLASLRDGRVPLVRGTVAHDKLVDLYVAALVQRSAYLLAHLDRAGAERHVADALALDPSDAAVLRLLGALRAPTGTGAPR